MPVVSGAPMYEAGGPLWCLEAWLQNPGVPLCNILGLIKLDGLLTQP